MPGVSYQRQVEYTPHGPVVLDVVTAPRPDGSLYTLAPVLSNNAIVATEKLTDIEKEASAAATVVGVNGDFFAANPGHAERHPHARRRARLRACPARSSLGIGADGTLTVARVGFDGTWRGNDQRRQLDLNRSPVAGHTDALHVGVGAGDAGRERRGRRRARLAAADDAEPHRDRGGSGRSRRGGACADPARRRRARRARQPGAASQRRGAGRHAGRDPPDADAQLARDERCDRRRAGACRGRQAGLPREGSRSATRCSTRAAARSAVAQLSDGRILLVTVEGGSLALQRRHDELRARRRARASRRRDRDGPRHRHVGRDGLRRHAAHAPVRRRGGAGVRRACSLLPRRLRGGSAPRATSCRRTATASTTRRRSRTGSCARRR